MVDTHPGPIGFSMPTVSCPTSLCHSSIAAGMPTGSAMACLSALRKILFSRMTTSSGFTAAADAAASSLVSGVDEDMKDRYAAFLTPLMASPTAEKRPFLPKPTGHSPPVAGASLAVSASVLLSPSFPGLRARVLVERRAMERPARRRASSRVEDLTDLVTQRNSGRAPRGDARVRGGNRASDRAGDRADVNCAHRELTPIRSAMRSN